MRQKILILVAVLGLIVGLFSSNTGSAYAAMHSSASRLTPLTSSVPCLPSVNKVGIQEGGGWLCYANPGTVSFPPNTVIFALHPDSWSGTVTIPGPGSTTTPLTFCDHQNLFNGNPTIIIRLMISQTREPGC